MDERQLIQRAQSGNAEAVEELLGRYEERIYRLVCRFFPDSGDAADAAQEVMIRIYDRLGDFAWRSAFSTWVYRITVNLCLDQVRKEKKRAEVGLPEQMVSPADGPEELSMRDETRVQVRQAMSGLSADHRAVLLLREVEGLDYSEIGVILGVSAGTVKSRLSRARETFRNVFSNLNERGDGHAVHQTRRSFLGVAGQ